MILYDGFGEMSSMQNSCPSKFNKGKVAYRQGRRDIMNKSTAAICEPVTVMQTCTHFWVVQSANGPVSRGTCRYCGATREFKNYPTDCAIENSAFRELFGNLSQDEPELSNTIDAGYIEKSVASGEGDDEYEGEQEALCAAV